MPHKTATSEEKFAFATAGVSYRVSVRPSTSRLPNPPARPLGDQPEPLNL
jgi:hypothetical protein